jgi:diadenosine tetraphosphate (Ap4A) HIT family hydrolase
MSEREVECPFCDSRAPVLEDELAFVIYDKHPVNPGHALFVSKRHVASYFDTTPEERAATLELLIEAHHRLDGHFAPDGYNIGVNVGETAGQTVGHVHIHLIPRFRGDVENPRGGVRGVIPARQSY